MKKVESTCREKNECNIRLTSSNVGMNNDPCPHYVKYGSIEYKCRPSMCPIIVFHFFNMILILFISFSYRYIY